MKHIVGFSGGIDSQACARWVLNRFPAEDVILTNTQAGRNEHDQTVAFVEEYSRVVHPVVVITPLVKDIWETEHFAERRGFNGDEELTFERLIEIKGCAPTRTKQFCTDILKLNPQRRWILEAFGPVGIYAGAHYERYSGKRREESESRKDTRVSSFDDFFDCELHAPLADWTKQMCFDYVKWHGERINPLYAMGFERVGCAPCINSGKNDVLRWHHRAPEIIDKVRGIEERTGRTYFAPCVPGKRTNTIDEVVEWSMTFHGGKVPNLLRVIDVSPNCESKYGLCE